MIPALAGRVSRHRGPVSAMTPTTTRPALGALLLLCGWLAAEALLQLLAAAIALLLTAAGWRPRQKLGNPKPSMGPAPVIPQSGDLGPRDQGMPAALKACTVVELRCLARAAGHRQLARSGRRADLLLALGAV